MKANVNVLAKPHPYTSFSHHRHAASLRAESAPIHAVVNGVHKYYTLITMTSLQFTQVSAQEKLA